MREGRRRRPRRPRRSFSNTHTLTVSLPHPRPSAPSPARTPPTGRRSGARRPGRPGGRGGRHCLPPPGPPAGRPSPWPWGACVEGEWADERGAPCACGLGEHGRRACGGRGRSGRPRRSKKKNRGVFVWLARAQGWAPAGPPIHTAHGGTAGLSYSPGGAGWRVEGPLKRSGAKAVRRALEEAPPAPLAPAPPRALLSKTNPASLSSLSDTHTRAAHLLPPNL